MTVTFIDWLVVRLPEGEMASQLPPELLAVNEVAVDAVTERVCAAGAALPKVALKVIDVGLTVMVVVGAAFTTNVTATVWLVRYAPDMVMVPL